MNKKIREHNLAAVYDMEELMLDIVTDMENRVCNCQKFTTSDVFWLGDHEPSCRLVRIITHMRPDDRRIKKIFKMTEPLNIQYPKLRIVSVKVKND